MVAVDHAFGSPPDHCLVSTSLAITQTSRLKVKRPTTTLRGWQVERQDNGEYARWMDALVSGLNAVAVQLDEVTGQERKIACSMQDLENGVRRIAESSAHTTAYHVGPPRVHI